jgi:hypothetical protein
MMFFLSSFSLLNTLFSTNNIIELKTSNPHLESIFLNESDAEVIYDVKLAEIHCAESALFQDTSIVSNPKTAPIFKSGYKGLLEYGRLVDWEGNAYSINVINAYQFNPYYMAGLGVGVRVYTEYEIARLPIFLYNQIRFSAQDYAPFFSFGVGYNSDTDGDDIYGTGLFLPVGLGLSVKLSEKLALSIGIVFETRLYHYDDYWTGNKIKDWEYSTGFNIGLGF